MTDLARSLLGSFLFMGLIVFPVFAYLKLRDQKDKKIVLSIFAIWLLWSAINTPIHEGAHALAGVLVGMHIRGSRFIQHYWEGDFVHGYVLWEPASEGQFLFSTAAPYVVDILIMLIAFVWFPRRSCTPLMGALLLSVTYLRSVFDVMVNYSADTLFGGRGDFDFLLNGHARRMVVHGVALVAILLGVFGAAREIRLAYQLKKEPSIKSEVSVAG